MVTRHGHQEDITFEVAPIGKHELLLGLPWCRLHQIQVDWDNNDIIKWGLECEQHFPGHIAEVTLGHTTQKELPPQEEQYRELKETIPEEYHDFLDVFDAEYGMSKCPERRPGYDFEIHLKEDTKLEKGILDLATPRSELSLPLTVCWVTTRSAPVDE